MATNPTKNTVEFLTQRLEREERYLDECIARITKYNTETIPAKAKAKKPKILEPIDIDTNTEVLGLRKAIKSYNYAISCVNGDIISVPEDSEALIQYMEKHVKNMQIHLDCAKNRLEKAKAKREKNMKQNPKKYSKRKPIPDVNSEIINDSIILGHYETAVSSMKENDRRSNGITIDLNERRIR